MVESIIVHFAEPKTAGVLDTFDEVAEYVGDSWSFPSNKNYQVMVYSYDDYSAEYEDSDKLEVVEALGCTPKFSFCIELRRSVQNEACELSKEILISTLSSFNFVVDDCMDKIWTKKEIEKYRHEFLKPYYYPRST